MSESNPIRIGLIGVGRAGWGMHVPELEGRKDKFKFVAACDTIPERCQNMADRFGCKTYAKAEDLVRDPEVELVCVATRSIDHFPHAMLAIEAGKAVMIEKPMCVTYEQALEIQRIDSDPTLPRIFPRFNRRFEQHFNRLLEIIDSGLLGDVFEVYISRNGYSRRDDWQTLMEFCGGNLLNWGPHIVDQSLKFVGGPVKSLYSDLKHTVAAGDAEDHVSLSFVGENNRTVTMRICGDTAIATPEYRVYGTRGAAEVINNNLHLHYIDPTQQLPPPVADRGTPGQSFGKSGTFASEEPVRWLDSDEKCGVGNLSVYWDYLYNSYRNGAPFPITMDEAVAVIKAITDAKKGTEFENK